MFDHHGIVACTYDANRLALATRIDDAIKAENDNLDGKFIRVYRPNL
ncbi:MAG: hypothetical protein ABMA02_19995 [Saprospiraceae bacterium]